MLPTSLLISWLFSKPIRKEFLPPFAPFLAILPTSVTSTQRSMKVIQQDNSVKTVLGHSSRVVSHSTELTSQLLEQPEEHISLSVLHTSASGYT